MDAVTAGVALGIEYPNGGGAPAQALVHLTVGRWAVWAVHATPFADTSVGVVQLAQL